jgi:hypothetical protein
MAKHNLGSWEEEEIAGCYGIVSEVNITTLCYHLNRELGKQLVRANEDKKGLGKNADLRYPLFSAYDPYLDVTWHLVSNRNPYLLKETDLMQGSLFAQALMSGAPLVRALKMIDYFFWCSGELKHYFDATFNIQLKSVSYVRAIQKLAVPDYKGLDVLTIE